MAVSQAQIKANRKYNAKTYDRLEINLPKGKKDEIKAHAIEFQPAVGVNGSAGHTPKGSVSAFILRAVTETIERDKQSSEANT
jgi:hypothetical protein